MATLTERTGLETFSEQRAIIEAIFARWEQWPKIANFKVVPVMDDTNHRYLLVTEGWDGYKRIYSVLIHVDIIEDKFWIQADNTEEGIATELVEAGVPKDKIVLGFKFLDRRKATEFAVN